MCMVVTRHKCKQHCNDTLPWGPDIEWNANDFQRPASIFESHLVLSFSAIVASPTRKVDPLNLESSTPGWDKIWRGMSHLGIEEAGLVWPVIFPDVLVLLLPGVGIPVMPRYTVTPAPNVSALLLSSGLPDVYKNDDTSSGENMLGMKDS